MLLHFASTSPAPSASDMCCCSTRHLEDTSTYRDPAISSPQPGPSAPTHRRFRVHRLHLPHCSLHREKCRLFVPVVSLTAMPSARASDDGGCASSNRTSTPTYLATRHSATPQPTAIPPSHRLNLVHPRRPFVPVTVVRLWNLSFVRLSTAPSLTSVLGATAVRSLSLICKRLIVALPG